MTIIEAVILGIVQGLTEFLPVSSSGHLALAQRFLKIEEANLFFDVLLHLGSLLATLWFFRGDIAALIRSLLGRGGADEKWMAGGGAWKYAAVIVVGSIPAGIVGVGFEDNIAALFKAPQFVCYSLIFTGALLLVAGLKRPGDKFVASSWSLPILIGVAQAVAVTPGISRSGSTIAAALLLGVAREDATRFSFLLSIPAILGAFALGAKDVTSAQVSSIAVPALFGMVAAFLSGLVALAVIVRVVKGRGLALFTPYLWVVAVASLILMRYL